MSSGYKIPRTQRDLTKWVKNLGHGHLLDFCQGTRHIKVIFCSRQVGLLSYNDAGQDTKNIEASIRRVLEAL